MAKKKKKIEWPREMKKQQSCWKKGRNPQNCWITREGLVDDLC